MLAGLALAVGAAADTGPAGERVASIAGDWRIVDEHTGTLGSMVRVRVSDGVVSARLVAVHDARTPDPICERCTGPLAGHPMVGLPIVSDLRFDGEGWSGGTILDPETGKHYRCRIRVADEGRTLMVRGYVGAPAFGRTLRWRKHEAF